MNLGVFLLLFVVFFVLIAVVVWLIRGSQETPPTTNESDEAEPQRLPDDPDEAVQWLEDLARRQEASKTRRLH